MNIDYPAEHQIPELKKLWQEAFSDSEEFVEDFFNHGFAPDRCRCVTVDGQSVAALYWFDCQAYGQPVAYLYAVATAKAHRSKGYCRALMQNSYNHLSYLGYAGAVVVPGTEELFRMYASLGYTTCAAVSEFSCAAAEEAVALRQIEEAEFAALRRSCLPQGGVLQEQNNLEFLQTMADFYAGEDFLLTVSRDENAFFAPELLGNTAAAPAILTAFGKKEGIFRTPGDDKPFAMYHPFTDLKAPEYFGFAFD